MTSLLLFFLWFDKNQNIGLHFETWNVGVLGSVTLKGLNSGTWDLSQRKWTYKVGLKGEALSLHTVNGSSSVEWVQKPYLAKKPPLTWYKVSILSLATIYNLIAVCMSIVLLSSKTKMFIYVVIFSGYFRCAIR